jgi:hypothetical protein
MAKSDSSGDQELKAMSAILSALEDLDGESIQRVLDYVFSRLSIALPGRAKTSPPLATPQTAPIAVQSGLGRRPSIRDLKDDKRPESSNQMAALVAYYLSEIVDGEEAKDTVSTSDLEKYFKQAGFKLPKSIPQTLSNATAAGYFDATGNGQYKLNAVGYNLVVHGLPRSHLSVKQPKSRVKKKKRPR